VLGVIYAPFLDRLYSAVKGGGAHCNGVRIKVSGSEKLQESLLLSPIDFTSFPQLKLPPFIKQIQSDIHPQCQALRIDGSACMSLVAIADGSADLMWHPRLQIWDVAAGVVIVQEAGGTVLTLGGLDYETTCRSIVAGGSERLARAITNISASSDSSDLFSNDK